MRGSRIANAVLPRGVVVYLKPVAPVVQASDPLHGNRQAQIFKSAPIRKAIPFAIS